MAGIQLLILVAAIAFASGAAPIEEWADLKVTFGFSPMTSFNSMPRTAKTAESDGWRSISFKDCKNGGKFNGHRYINEDDVSLSLLFDTNGIIAGIQMNLLKKEIQTPDNPFKYDRISMYQSDVIDGKEVLVLTAYFVDPSIICSTGRSNQELKKGTGTMLRFQNGPTPTDLIEAPLKRDKAIMEGWSKNNCFYGMGYHNFYKSEETQATNCKEMRPAFLLFDNSGRLHGFGFAAPGYATSSRFEHPGSSALKSIIGKDVAQCVLDIADKPGFSSMHVYFIERPYLIHCWW